MNPSQCLDHNTPIVVLQGYLNAKKLLKPSEQILRVEKPGEGNMNVVLRVITNIRSFIVKQSRPYVQKYQQIEAPLNRIAVEYLFYNTVQCKALNAHIPEIIAYDSEDHLLILEDLGHCEDLTTIYEIRKVSNYLLEKLVKALQLIHQSKLPANFPDNLMMRQLNHQHIFELPFLKDNGFPLDDIQNGLQELSLKIKTNESLKKTVKEVGEKYLSRGTTLLHGDFYPGSWMTANENLYIIDPEFGFVGFPEFDLGVMAGHIVMATGSDENIDLIIELYQKNIDQKLLKQICGIEIIRRIIGLAQLPLNRSLSEKEQLLAIAQKMIQP